MTRSFLFLLAFLIAGRALATTFITLTGAGAGGVQIGAGTLTPPSITPQVSAAFDANTEIGYGNGGLKVNGGTGAAGPFEYPPTPTNSEFVYFEGKMSPAYGNQSPSLEYMFSGADFTSQQLGVPALLFQPAYDGTAFNWWRGLTGVQMQSITPVVGAGGSGYNAGVYQWTGVGGGCQREPTGTWVPNAATVITVDPGFGCNVAPVALTSTIPGIGTKQSTNATSTCVANSPVTGQETVTVSVGVAHGVYPGMSFVLAGYTPSSFSGTYTAIAGTSGTTLVGQNTGTCSGGTSASIEGTALSGANGTLNIPLYALSPFTGGDSGTGITAQPGTKFCAIVGEYGANSLTPGMQFWRLIDENGNDLSGSPAIPPILNQGAINFTGYTVAGTQDTTAAMTASFTGSVMTVTTITGAPLVVGTVVTGPSIAPNTTISSFAGGSGGTGTYNMSTSNTLPSSTLDAYHNYVPALTVTSMNSYSITGATWASAGNGQATFTTGAAHGFAPGAVFTVTGMTPSGYNGEYVALAGTTGSTLIGGLYTPGTGPSTLASPGSFSSGGSMTGVIMPGMQIIGTTGSAIIAPYGHLGGTGSGGVGTYALSVNQATFTANTTSMSSGVMTVGAAPGTLLAVGEGVVSSTGTGSIAAGTVISSLGTGAGGTGTYNLSSSITVTSGTVTFAGTLGTTSSPVNLYASNPYYWSAAPSPTAAGGATLATHTQANFGDLFQMIGTKSNASAAGGLNNGAWGGNLANFGMHWGVFPQDSSGNPSKTSLASLCNKTTDFLAFDSAIGATTRSLYRLNDPGIWADSGIAQFNGSISGTSLTINSTQSGSTTVLAGGDVIAGVGVTGCPSACPTIASGSGASYTLNKSGGTVSAESMTAGLYKPALPIASAVVNGYLTASGGSGVCASGPCLNVSSYQTGSIASAFTGTLNGTTLTTTGATGTIAIGQVITDGGASITGAPLVITGGSGSTWTVGANYYGAITSDAAMVGTGSTLIPGQYIYATGITTPVMITGYGALTPCATTGALGCGTYPISTAANGSVGSSGSPVAITTSGVTGGGAIEPGPALTIKDVSGTGTMYAIDNYPSASPTATVPLSGTYNTSALGGTPSAIQAQISLAAGGPAISGFSWANLSSGVVSGGNWSGKILHVPAGGPYWVSIRAANGTAYATLPSSIKVGAVFPTYGEGVIGAITAQISGSGGNASYSTGLFSAVTSTEPRRSCRGRRSSETTHLGTMRPFRTIA